MCRHLIRFTALLGQMCKYIYRNMYITIIYTKNLHTFSCSTLQQSFRHANAAFITSAVKCNWHEIKIIKSDGKDDIFCSSGLCEGFKKEPHQSWRWLIWSLHRKHFLPPVRWLSSGSCSSSAPLGRCGLPARLSCSSVSWPPHPSEHIGRSFCQKSLNTKNLDRNTMFFV